MIGYSVCQRCGAFTDDGGTRLAVIEGELRRAWLCPECFDEDDEVEAASSASTEVEI